MLISLLNVSDEKMFSSSVSRDIDLIAKAFIERLKNDNLTDRDDIFLERHAYEINNRIKDINIRNMNILEGV